MARIDFISDLHVANWRSFWGLPNVEDSYRHIASGIIKETKLANGGLGDALIIAGDVSEVVEEISWVLDEFSKYYADVYFTFGNHDYYFVKREGFELGIDSFFKESLLRECCAENPKIHILINEIVTIGNLRVGFSPFWYKIEPDIEWYLSNCYNDFRLIKGKNKEFYERDRAFWNSIGEGTVDLMVTHIPPVLVPVSEYPEHDLFISRVESFKGIKHWICGHVHNSCQFEKDGVNFYMNVIGYPRETAVGCGFKGAERLVLVGEE